MWESRLSLARFPRGSWKEGEACLWLSTLSTAPAFPQLSDPHEGGTGATVRAKRVNGWQYPERLRIGPASVRMVRRPARSSARIRL
jgi:hypothetical protein